MDQRLHMFWIYLFFHLENVFKNWKGFLGQLTKTWMGDLGCPLPKFIDWKIWMQKGLLVPNLQLKEESYTAYKEFKWRLKNQYIVL